MTQPKLENKRYIKIAIIGGIIVIGAVTAIKLNYDDWFDPASPGVGKVGSAHVHAKIGIHTNDGWVSMNPNYYQQFIKQNKYIYLDVSGANRIHRVATGATLGLFFESIGMTLTEECFTIPEGTSKSTNVLFEKTEFCTDGKNYFNIYLRCNACDRGEKLEDPLSYIIEDNDGLLITYDESDASRRQFR